MNADPRIAEIAKALDAWEFDSFGNTRDEHWEAAPEIALRIADAAPTALLRRIRAALVDQKYAMGLNPEMTLILRELQEAYP